VRDGPSELRALPAHARLAEAFFAGRSPQTLRAYRQDLADFAAFAGVADVEAAAGVLLAAGQGGANELALRYRAELQARGLSPATVNRRLAALRSLVKLARTLGMVPWALDVEGLRGQSYRDTAGPGVKGVREMIAAAGRSTAAELRNAAIMRLLADLALRRKEVVGLDLGDVDLQAGTLMILGKGRLEKERLTLPAPTRVALAAWLAARPGGTATDAPLFVNMDRARKGDGRLTGSGLYKVVRAIGGKTGRDVHPHAVRHSAITAALDAGLDVREVQRFSRHRDVRTLMVYDDNRKDLAGKVASRVADAFGDDP
jgi:integrase/recombinase XerC